METLLFAIVVLVLVGIVCAIAYYIPFPPPLLWLRWLIPVLALVVGLIAIAQRLAIV